MNWVIGLILILIGGGIILRATIKKPARTQVFKEEAGSLEGIQAITVKGTSIKMNINADADADADRFTAVLAGEESGRQSELRVTEYNNTLRISIETENTVTLRHLFFSTNSSLQLTITLPLSYQGSLQAEVTSGSAEISPSAKKIWKLDKLTTRSTSGAVNLRNINADVLKHRGTSGSFSSIHVDSGDAELEMSSGAIAVRDHGGRLKAKVTSGNFNGHFLPDCKSVDIDCTSGDIQLIFDKDTPISLEQHVTSGKLDCRHPLAYYNRENAIPVRVNLTSGKAKIDAV